MLKTDAAKIAKELMQQHMPDMVNKQGWGFGWHNSVHKFGVCHFGNRTITLSTQLVGMNDAERVKRTVLHEIAHALAGRKAKHGKKWQAICVQLGGDGQTYWSEENTTRVPPKYIGTCPAGHVSYAYRKRRTASSCGKCSPVFNRDHLITYRANIAM